MSHLPPIVLRDLKDGTEALIVLRLWALGPILKVQVKVEESKFDYVLKLQSLLFLLIDVFYHLLLNKIKFY